MNLQKTREQQLYISHLQFGHFVDDVTPKEAIQQVISIGTILAILWQVFQILKDLGFFKKWLAVRKVRAAMALPGDREANLQAVLDKLRK